VGLEGAVPAERVETGGEGARARRARASGARSRDHRAGTIQYFLARRSPRRLLDALTNRAVRRLVKRGRFSGAGPRGRAVRALVGTLKRA
jgi:hypothetical protein